MPLRGGQWRGRPIIGCPREPFTDDVTDLFEKEQSGLYRVRIFLLAEHCYILYAESTGAYQEVRRR